MPDEPAPATPPSPESLAQAQLDAYNARDLERFLALYAEDVEIFAFPHDLRSRGKAAMRERYGRLFAASPQLHARLVNRIVQGPVVIDQEQVSGHADGPAIAAIAIYEIADGLIARATFIRG